MSNIKTIIKKELDRFFKDKRLLLTTIFLPGIMIFVMYSLMGSAIDGMFTPDAETYQIAAINAPTDFTNSLDAIELDYVITTITNDELDTYKDKVLNSEIDYLIVFPDNFEDNLGDASKPNVNTYYNPNNELSSSLQTTISGILGAMHQQYIYENKGDVTQFTINVGNDESALFHENEMFGKMYAMMLPLLIIIFLFSGAMSVAPESIAGDKERGTMATLLATPTKRRDIALGKITALSIISVLSAISSFIGIIASLPKLFGSAGGEMKVDIYNFGDYAVILGVLIVTVLLIVGLISIVSAFAKNTKESNSLILPLYFATMAIGIATMFSQSAASSWLIYLIPIYNSLQCMVAVFTFDVNVINVIICFVANIVYTGLLVVLLTKMFNSEKIMFSK